MKKNDRYREAQKEIGKVLKKKGSVTFEDFLAQYGDHPINPHLHTTKQLNKIKSTKHEIQSKNTNNQSNNTIKTTKQNKIKQYKIHLRIQ